eukprot:TRINITY_DN23526_c0_g2_i3.p1 TRINITY_DN23526_c0_g2~~TRINITY_DN23526_c0_g2_i3.p1  ORF type:complete len:569 (+),score=109.61 TRINITY_DN23526_c0_g2_i3:644-2350(+)
MLRLMAAFALFVRSGTAQEALSLEFPSSSPASLSLNDGIKQLLEFATSMHPEMGLPEPMASAGRRLLQVPTALGDPGFANEFNEEDLPGRFNKVMEDLKSVVHGARARAEKDNILDVPAAKHARSYLDLEKRLLKDSGLNITDDSEPMPHVAAERNSTASEDVHVLWGAQAGLAKKSPENAYRKQKMKDFNRARCGGLIIQATLFAAEFGIQVTGAVESCGNVTSVVRQRMCTRQIFVSMRAITQIVKDALTAYGDCNDSKNTACAATVTNTFARAMYLGEYGARMALLCTQENFAENRRTALGCGLRLELFAWQIGPFSGDLAKAARVCVANPDYGKPLLDYGWCVGDVLSSVGFLAATALEFYYADQACRESDNLCVESLGEATSALSIGANKAIRAAGWCGGFQTRCGADLSLLGAALSKVGVQAARVDKRCPKATTKEEKALCAAEISDLLKFLSVSAAKSMDVAGRCTAQNKAGVQCGSNIAKAMAAFSFISNQISEAVVTCTEEFFNSPPAGYYLCGRHYDRIGTSARVISSAIALAYVDCNLNADEAALREPIPLPNRFFI